MQEILNHFGEYILGALMAIILFFISRFAIGYSLSRVIVKIFTLGLVLYFAEKLVSSFITGVQMLLPDNSMFSSLMCQFGFLEGMNIYFTFLMTIYFYKLTIRVLIQS